MRIRITYSKTENLVYTSTLDVQTIWERSVRRANLGLQYSQGFHPQPRIQIANPLPLGFVGLQELIDIWLVNDLPLNEIQSALSGHLPEGMQIVKIESLPENAPSLPKQVEASEYGVSLVGDALTSDELEAQIALMLEKETLPRVRNQKAYDLRPLIHTLDVEKTDEGCIQILLRMPSNPGQTGRPEEVMAELGIPMQDFRITRTRLILSEKYA